LLPSETKLIVIDKENKACTEDNNKKQALIDKEKNDNVPLISYLKF
jgi:hypothetical protein